MHDQNHETLTHQQQVIATSTTRAASCPVRGPYRASAPGVAEAAGAGAAPEMAGPGVPTAEGVGDTPRSASTSAIARRRPYLSEPRERRVRPRYSQSEYDDLKRAAGQCSMAVGAYVAEASLTAARAENPEAAVADYRRAVRELMTSNRQIAAVGNNLNQLTRHLNMDSPWPERDVVRALLKRVEAALADVDAAVAHVLRR